MALFRRKPKTRSELVVEADRARVRGKLDAAAAGYRRALESDPADASVHVKLAPVLARLGDPEGAARSFRAAAQKHLDAGFTDRAAAVNATAAGVLPLDAGFRLELARLEMLRGRRRDAAHALADGGRALLRARRDEAGVSLLRKALEIEPSHLEAALALAPALARSGDRAGALALLRPLESALRGSARRRVRWVTFRVAPSPRTLWRWITG